MNEPKETPPVMTIEEMQALLANTQPKKPKPKSTKKPPPKQPSVADKAKTEVPDELCYIDMHFWLREGDLFGTVCNDARERKAFSGPGVTVFAHDHLRSEPCSNNCKQIKEPK